MPLTRTARSAASQAPQTRRNGIIMVGL